MYNFTPQTICTINNDLAYTYIDDETVIMGVINEQLYGINNIGTYILKQIAMQATSFKNIIDNLVEKFDVTKLQCTQDLNLFLHALMEQKLIKIVS